jgi:hypothetical protein
VTYENTTVDNTPDLEAQAKAKAARRKALSLQVLGVSVALHVLGGLGATVWIVSRIPPKVKPVFKAVEQNSIAAAEREYKVSMDSMEAAAAPPAMSHRIASMRPSEINLPELPRIPSDDVLAIDPDAQLIDQPISADGTVIGAGEGSGSGTGSGGRGRGVGLDALNFFGIKDEGRSVVIMIDVSDSMFGRTGDYDYTTRTKLREGKDQSFQRVRDEAAALIGKLSINTRFGIVRWSGGAYPWRPELVPATEDNKKAAIDHINNEVDVKTAGPRGGRPGGTRHDYALEEAFKLKPEVIFMLSDGNATQAGGPSDDRDNRNNRGGGFGNLQPIPEKDILDVIDAGQATLEIPARIHTIYYVTGQDKADEKALLRSISRKNNGTSKTVKADKK